ncbi:hypothetical protein EDS67_28730 [candidate division KSB1 bacterium]|nr:MAG: hypothetical protein EDS67_28730 [candidate division KSB1 bacterium]MCE7945442.1 hypothetical protein [Chlorobi bacterium CHB1]
MLLISSAAFSQTASIASVDTQDFSALSTLKNGQRIRVVSTSQGKLIGEFAELRGDTLLLRAGSGELLTLTQAALLAVWQRTNSSRTVATVGAIAGALSGALAGATMAGLANLDCETHCQDLTALHLLSSAIGGLMGAAVGATIPAWQQVYAKN